MWPTKVRLPALLSLPYGIEQPHMVIFVGIVGTHDGDENRRADKIDDEPNHPVPPPGDRIV